MSPRIETKYVTDADFLRGLTEPVAPMGASCVITGYNLTERQRDALMARTILALMDRVAELERQRDEGVER